MPKLPIFSTIGQAMAVFGLHIGRLFKWVLIPIFLGGGVVGIAFGLAAWKDAIGHGLNVWLIPMVPAILFAIQTFLPFAIRVNQLAVLGRVEQTGYLGMIFSSQSFRYLGYASLVSLILFVGFALGLVPVSLAGAVWKSGITEPRTILGILASVALILMFLILTSPLNLIYPAVAVEQDPALGKAYHLGSHRKFRIFLCVFLSALLFAVLFQLVELIGEAFGLETGSHLGVVLIPVHLFLTFFSYVTSVAIPAVAYRILSGLPDPNAPQADASGEPPAPSAPEHPGNSEAGGPLESLLRRPEPPEI